PCPNSVCAGGRRKTLENVVALLNWTAPRPRLPDLVVIMIAPFTPSEPYNAAALAPFNTVMLSMSFGFNRPISGIGTPSTTNMGSFSDRLNERVPRKRTCTVGSVFPEVASLALIRKLDTLEDKAKSGLITRP